MEFGAMDDCYTALLDKESIVQLADSTAEITDHIDKGKMSRIS